MKLIKNGSILTAEAEYQGDILIRGETIWAVGKNLDGMADEVIDATGKYIFPGGLDEHTHFGSFGGRLFETTEAAAAGGTTTIVDFAPQEQGDSLGTAIEKHAAKAAGVSCVDFSFHSMVMDMQLDTVEQMKELPEHGGSCVKMFMAYKGTPYYMEDDSLLKVMNESKRHGITMMVHAEDPGMISFYTERLKTKGHSSPVNHAYSRPPNCGRRSGPSCGCNGTGGGCAAFHCTCIHKRSYGSDPGSICRRPVCIRGDVHPLPCFRHLLSGPAGF